MADNVLHVEHITMQFGGVVAVNDLTLDVDQGEIVALIGPNGAGKTTAFNCVTGVYEPTNGLDVLTAKVVTDFLQQLRDQGKTIIVSTHIFSLIEKLCDRVGVIINGRMVLCDALDRVTAGESLEDRFFEIYRETVGDGV